MPALDPSAPTPELTRRLVDIASVSGDEAPLADAIEAAVRSAPHLEVERLGDAIVARTNLGRAQRVVIAGHIDTVPINGNVPATLVDDPDGAVLWGRGTVDMKGGCAVMLALAIDLPEPVVDVTWVWYDNEEVDSALNGLGRIARERPELLAADFAILGEPSNAEVEGGCNGTIRVDVTTRGKRAHSARAWMGENAIHAAAPILSRLAAYEPREVEVDGLVYRESLSAVKILGGVAGNVIPDECTIHVNYRFAPSRSGAEALAHLEELVAGLGAEVTVADLAEGARPGLDAPLAQQFLRAVGGAARPKYGWTDVARFSALGIPAVNYGPGDPSLAHADDERVPVEQIERVEAGLRRWLTAAD
ncbi:succinyl-diaminopimelate desuccinylase [Homoserinibacter sp. GY 40078]|uniref:succinyl-diaminopimelate desuccinylase n=1 Tax=Homoserinibacter sp. GY 40078 TaxID=2603275 RepID=UPI0011C7EC69|nr:succinyl-diaminopimelate desuccinylase [Homoserinibacter sp. GY 40078]TXK19603.1 succinyl-diaminopimelate desuccinylase [Homoserinibacter sp. GY 40078]